MPATANGDAIDELKPLLQRESGERVAADVARQNAEPDVLRTLLADRRSRIVCYSAEIQGLRTSDTYCV